MLLNLIFITLTAGAADFPVCEGIFLEIDTVMEDPSADVEGAKKKLFKIANDKRTEVVRFARTAKSDFRKTKDDELKSFDLDKKKNPPGSAEARKQQRTDRGELVRKISDEKKQFNNDIAEKEKACHKYLSERRDFYLAKFRDLKKTSKAATDQSSNPEQENEFDTIPKGPGIVLKPQ